MTHSQHSHSDPYNTLPYVKKGLCKCGQEKDLEDYLRGSSVITNILIGERQTGQSETDCGLDMIAAAEVRNAMK